MTCSEADKRELAEQYVAGRLSPEEMERYESHFFECGRCTEELARLEAVSSKLRVRPIKADQTRRFPLLNWRIGWVAAVGLVCVVGVALWSHRAASPVRSPDARSFKPLVLTPPPGYGPSTIATAEADEPAPPSNAVRAGSHAKVPKGTPAGATPVIEDQPAATTATGTGPAMPELPTPPSGEPAPPKAAVNRPPQPPKTPTTPDNSDSAALFFLGQFEPPPYTYTGFHPTKPPKDHSAPSGQSINGGSSTYTPGPRVMFRSAMAEYSNRNFLRALSLLEENAKDEPSAIDANFYLGICFLVRGEQKPALEAFETALRQGHSSYEEQIHFFMAKALLQQQHIKEAEQQLEETKKFNGRFHAESDRMLKSLHELHTQPTAP